MYDADQIDTASAGSTALTEDRRSDGPCQDGDDTYRGVETKTKPGRREDKARCEHQENREAEEQARKTEAKKIHEWECLCGNKVFGGNLSSKNKGELEDIAHALGILEEGKKEEISG